jgi:PPPDE putative peptidase domain
MNQEVTDVILNVYKIHPSAEEERRTSFWVRSLSSVGLGLYHTSLSVPPYTYTFVANQGIVSTRGGANSAAFAGTPNMTFQEELRLGDVKLPRDVLNKILQILKDDYFTPTSYHLVHRNCNHFTETLATVLLCHDTIDTTASSPRLSTTYPAYINRLAQTGAHVISHDEDIVPCLVAREALDVLLRVKGGTTKPAASATAKGTGFFFKAPKETKKELTEQQKQLLAKIRKK